MSFCSKAAVSGQIGHVLSSSVSMSVHSLREKVFSLTLRTVSTVAVNTSRSNTYRLGQMNGARKKRGHADTADIIDARFLSSPGELENPTRRQT
jgi:hypothetical protein